ncbi:hypothetical protein F4809DRAFT_605407 [Biscogniauxia mediterranea]|nr:hypothetical protein F4809DRAFT_605407 [Biscogniauxia mediterranea]
MGMGIYIYSVLSPIVGWVVSKIRYLYPDIGLCAYTRHRPWLALSLSHCIIFFVCVLYLLPPR